MTQTDPDPSALTADELQRLPTCRRAANALDGPSLPMDVTDRMPGSQRTAAPVQPVLQNRLTEHRLHVREPGNAPPGARNGHWSGHGPC